MQSLIHSTCCSMDKTMLESTEGLPGPVMVNRFGKPAIIMPRYVHGPPDQCCFRETPALPRISMLLRAPVMASKPVAHTMLSSAYSAFAVRTPVQVISRIGVDLASISVTLARLNVA